MTGRVERNCRYLLLLMVGWVVVALPGVGQKTSAGTTPAYDEVSIHPANPDRRMMWTSILPDRFSSTGISLKSLIRYAYNIKTEDQISGIVGPVGSARFDIEAKLDENTATGLKKLEDEDATSQRRLMMQSMLADRFKLKVHFEPKEIPIYALVVAKGGFKLKEADPNNTYSNGIKGPDGLSHAGMIAISNSRITGQGISMSSLAANVAGQVQRIVEDKTGLTGKYDVALHWLPEDNQAAPLEGQAEAAAPTDTGISIFTALQEQLGLKLESRRETVDTIVVDHVEMPSEN